MNAEEFEKSHIILKKETVSAFSSNEVPGKFFKDSTAFDLEHFKKNLKVNIGSIAGNDMEFDLIGVDPSFANAVRRIAISEVPTVAAEKVFVMRNSSLLSDEVLSHRIGLIPLDVDPNMLEFHEGENNEENVLVFELSVKCTSKGLNDDSLSFEKRYNNHFVLSSDLKWVPQGNQLEKFSTRPPKPLIDDIVIAKLTAGQEIDIKIFCMKSIGADHAKWSPVATASYRLLPEIIIKKEILNEDADKFASCFPKGVIQVVRDENSGSRKAVVACARKDTVSRECLRHEEFQDKVVLARKKDHFIFSIESVGAIPPQVILRDSLKILIGKCKKLRSLLDSGSAEEHN